jgi:DNA repair protein RecN (Recombination protein N)
LLVELSIQNVAIIDSLRLEFDPGLNVLSGETGTGKSIIIDAVGLLLGGRASAEIIRTGCEAAAVEGVFSLSARARAALETTLQELGLLDDSDQLILRREISRSSRSVCRVNGRAVTLSTLQEIGRHLIDVHGQGDHLSLMQARHHIEFLDRYGGILDQRRAFGALVQKLRQVRGELRSLQQDERELARRVDLLTFQVEEIRAADLKPGEESELRRERSLLANAEKLTQLSSTVYELLSEGEENQRSVIDLLGSVGDSMAELAKLDDTLKEQSQLAEAALYQLEELTRAVRNYRDGVEYDPQRLQTIEERIDLIQSLKRKYGDSIEEVLAFAEHAQAELNAVTHSEERTAELQAAEQALLTEIAAAGQVLHTTRLEAAERLQKHIEAELAELSMERAHFLVNIRWSEAPDGAEISGKRYAFDANGLDKVEFLISANPGEEPKPLVKVASGGETSRLMLAMKTALTSADLIPTLIFDEIDAGIGGRTGSIVGHKLWALAEEHQVFCVTHLPQIACFGGRHLRVTKDIVGERTTSSVQALTPEERIDELAVMLGGALTNAARRSAQELLKRVADMRPKKAGTV